MSRKPDSVIIEVDEAIHRMKKRKLGSPNPRLTVGDSQGQEVSLGDGDQDI